MKLDSGNVDTRKPTVIIPYPGPSMERGTKDIVVYLRPETNGVVVESILFKVIRENPLYRDNISMCYLANLPGDFIIRNRIVESHYSLKLFFAVNAKRAFTPFMISRFEKHFGVKFEDASIVGAFEALKLLDVNYEGLFNIWVPDEMMLNVDGQNIKKYGGIYIVNYDIPAILHKNNNKTDVAVMIFRSKLIDEEFHRMIVAMADRLIEKGILSPDKPISRIFHYSKGPYEEILDGMGYIYQSDAKHIPLCDISFFHYLKKKGMDDKNILGIVKHPIVQFKKEIEVGRRVVTEDSIFLSTAGMDYKSAYSFIRHVIAQPIIPGYDA